MKLTELRTYAVVSIATLVIWIYAEGESRRVVDAPAAVRLPRQIEGDRMFWFTSGEETVEINLQLDGTTAATDQARQALAGAVIDLTESESFPAQPGAYTLSVRDLLREHPVLRRVGVDIVSAEPPTLPIEIDQVERKMIPVRPPQLEGVEIETPTFTPSTAAVLIPKEFADRTAGWTLVAALSPEQITGSSGTVLRISDAPLELVGEGIPSNYQIEPRTADVTIMIRVQTRTVTLPAVPVYLRGPPSVFDEWDVEIVQPEFLTNVTITGPVALVDSFGRDPSDPLSRPVFAYVNVLPDDPELGVTSKEARFTDFPGGQIEFRVDERTIRLRYKRRPPTPADEGPDPDSEP